MAHPNDLFAPGGPPNQPVTVHPKVYNVGYLHPKPVLAQCCTVMVLLEYSKLQEVRRGGLKPADYLKPAPNILKSKVALVVVSESRNLGLSVKEKTFRNVLQL